MQCPQCGADNPTKAKFCLECGAKLALVCPQCKAELPPGAKFCFECGARVGEVPAPAAPPPPPPPGMPSTQDLITERLKRLVPKEFADRLLSLKGKVEGERRMVTILFSDVKGSTAMAERLDPEDVMEIMNGAFDKLIAPIYKHEGTLARLMGDAILAFFGAPLSHEDDPQRACKASLEILAGIQEYAAQLERERGIQGFNVRVGINTGLVVVGEIGSDMRVEYTAMGDAINLAARMEQNAPAGGVMISQNTYRLVRGAFDTQALEPVTVKGKSEPVQVYQVLRLKPRLLQTQGRGIEGLDTLMVGRDAELKRLQETSGIVREDSELQVFTICGEAGVGKSRLVGEFEYWLGEQTEPARIFYGRASAEQQNSPYALLHETFTLAFDIHEDDSTQSVQEKFEKGLAAMLPGDPQAVRKAHFIGQLLAFDFSDSPYIKEAAGDARQVRDRALNYLVEYFKAACLSHTVSASKGLVALLLDDIHWADDSSLDAVMQLAAQMQDQRILIISLARPSLYERRPHWGEGLAFHTRMELQKLSNRDRRRLADEILQQVEEVPPALRDMLVTGSEGNPLHMEELVKVLIDKGVIIAGDSAWKVDTASLESLSVPATLTGVLQARLDNLPIDQRLILQQAAVVGSTFWDKVIEQLNLSQAAAQTGVSTSVAQPAGHVDVSATLASLRGRELLFQHEASMLAGSQEFAFKQTAMRDVAYESILKRIRKSYHAQVAAWLIQQSGERLREQSGLIAEHLEQAGQTAEAVGYLCQAAEDAAARFANDEAQNYFSRAIRLLSALQPEPSDLNGQLYALHLGREAIYSLAGRRSEQAADLETLAQLAEKLDDERKQAEVKLKWAYYYEAISNFPASQKAAQEAMDRANQAGDMHIKADGLVRWGVALYRQGQQVESQKVLEQALAIAQECKDEECQASSLFNLGTISFMANDLKMAGERWEEVSELQRKRGDQRGEARCRNNLVAVYSELGDLSHARISCQQALLLYQSIGDQRGEAHALSNLATILHRLGYLEAARNSCQEAMRIWQVIGNLQGQAVVDGNLALVLCDLQDYAKARELAEKSLAVTRAIHNRPSEGYKLTALALALEGLGEYQPAAENYQQALQLRRELGQQALAMDDLAGLARLSLKQGEIPQAVAYAQEMMQWVDSNGTSGIEYPLQVYLAAFDIFAAASQDEKAKLALSTAQGLLKERATLISDEESRKSYLENIPCHQRILELEQKKA